MKSHIFLLFTYGCPFELYFVFLTTFVDVETLTLMRFDLFTCQGTQPLPYFKLLKQNREGFYIEHVCVFVATRTLHCGSVQFLARRDECPESYCRTPGVGVSVGVRVHKIKTLTWPITHELL